jgi:hypothetical protein
LNTDHAVLKLRLHSASGEARREVAVRHLSIASWTARNRAAMEDRLLELERLGVPRPPSLPMFYRISRARATTASAIEVLGEETTGEAEFVLLRLDNRLWIGVGSDHTDRNVESQSAALSKQLCCKPLCSEFWELDEISAHWEKLRLRSFVTTSIGVRETYQDGSVAAMLPPHELVALWESAATVPDSSLLFCGTLQTNGPIRPAAHFDFELEDPVLGRVLSHGYDVAMIGSKDCSNLGCV